MNKKLLGIEIPTEEKEDILEKILEGIPKGEKYHHVMSLNPEIFVQMHNSIEFKKVVAWSQTKIVDGFGVVLAAHLLGVPVGARLTGVDMMDEVIKRASAESLSVLLIGGKEKVAEKLADCYRSKYSSLTIRGIQGVSDIQNPNPQEEDEIFSIVADMKPHIIFTAFGSPYQELWMYKHRDRLKGSVCAGVGGSFDFLSGNTPRAPRIMRSLGLEWLYRLVREPWRWKRQIRLLIFVWMVLKQKLGYSSR